MRIKIALSALILAISFPSQVWATQSNLVAGNFPTVSPYSGLSLVNNINTAMTTLLSNNAGSSSPSYAVSDMFWANTGANLETFTPNGTSFYPIGAFGNSTWTAISDGVPDDGPSSTGSSNAYVVTYSPAPSALVTGHIYKFITNFAVTGSATVNFNALGALNLTKRGATALASGDLGSGVAVTCMDDGAGNCQITSQLSSSASGGVSSIATTSPVCGGTITSTGTLNLCSQANDTVLANISGSSASPSATGSPVVTSIGFGSNTSSATGNMVHSPSTNAVAIASNGTDALTAYSDQGIVTAGATGGDQGSGTVNMTGCYVNGVSCAGTSAMTLLHTQVCTSGSPCSSVIFNSTYITTTYARYLVSFSGMQPTTANANIYIQLSSNNGSSYLSTYDDVGTQLLAPNSGSPTPNYFGGLGTSQVDVFNVGLTNASNAFSSGSVTFSDLATTSYAGFEYKTTGFVSGAFGTQLSTASGSGSLNSAASINAIKIYASTGNEIGTFSIYGLSH